MSDRERPVHRYGTWMMYADAGAGVLRAEGDHAQALTAIRNAHEAVESPHVPKVLDGGPTHLRFACEPLVDVGTAIRSGALRQELGDYGEGVAFNELMMDTLETAHHAPGGPYCLGALSFSNFLVDADGEFHLFGLGHNFPIHEGTGRSDMSAGSCRAPEVLLGAEPTPTSDVFCVHAMLQRMLPYVRLPPAFLQAIAGVAGFEELRKRLIQLSEDAGATDPQRRIQTIAELRGRYREIRTLVPTMPIADKPALADRFSRLVGRIVETKEPIVVDRMKRTVQLPGGVAFDLQRRRVLWTVFLSLVDAHRATPDRVVTFDALQGRAWPNERILPRAARARVYVAVSDLRKRGLGSWILKREGGYLLAPAVQVQVV